MTITEVFENERRWFRTRAKLKKGYKNVFCAAIRRRISWDWIKADAEWKSQFRTIRDQAHLFVSDAELSQFLTQNLKS